MTEQETIAPMTEYETILVETRGRVGWITLNRPEALNALNTQVVQGCRGGGIRLRRRRGVSARSWSPARSGRSPRAPTSRRWSEKYGLDLLMADHFGGWADFAAVRTP